MKKINVIITDNNKFDAQSLKNYLIKKEIIDKVEITKDGIDTLNLFKQINADVIICDLFIPSIDGFGVVEKINEMELDKKPLILLTSITVGDYIFKKVKKTISIDCFIPKPVNKDFLYNKIINMIEKKEEVIDCDKNILSKLNKSIPLINKLDYSNNVYPNMANKIDTKYKNLNLEIEIEIANILHKLGIPANIKGYRYLQDAIKMAVNNVKLLDTITKELYPSVAEKNNTTPSKVERAIRHAIEVAGVKGNVDAIRDLFNISLDLERVRPKNSEFIAKISEAVRLEFTK